jgi:hypothetical protein
MGEFAEMAIQEGLDAELSGEFDDEDGGDYTPRSKTCRQCGTGYLYWGSAEKGWRLFDVNGKLHSCSKPKEIK